MKARLKEQVKSLVEKTFGVTVTRRLPVPNTKFDPALSAIRRWSSDDVVFDVGANDGRTVLRLVEQLAFPRIYAFEPVAATYNTLRERTAHLNNVQCFQLAMGEKPGRQEIYLHDIDAMNSFSPSGLKDPGNARTETVEVATVDRVMADQGVEFVHLLKVDTEGYEMHVLHGAHKALSESRIGLVVLELGFDQGDRAIVPLEEARRHLAPLGYRLYGIYTQARARMQAPPGWPAAELEHYKPNVLVYCDALFLRADLEGERV